MGFGIAIFDFSDILTEERQVTAMYKLCKTEQSTARQRQIEEGLLELMGMKKYDDITVSDLCERLGIPRKSFYRYFSGKDGALFGLIDHRLLEYENRPDEKVNLRRNGFYVDIDWFFTFWKLQKPLLDALERSGLSGVLVERIIHGSQEAEALEYPDYPPDYVRAVTSFTICGMMSMVLQWHHEGYEKSVEDMAALARELLGRPLIPGLEV